MFPSLASLPDVQFVPSHHLPAVSRAPGSSLDYASGRVPEPHAACAPATTTTKTGPVLKRAGHQPQLHLDSSPCPTALLHDQCPCAAADNATTTAGHHQHPAGAASAPTSGSALSAEVLKELSQLLDAAILAYLAPSANLGSLPNNPLPANILPPPPQPWAPQPSPPPTLLGVRSSPASSIQLLHNSDAYSNHSASGLPGLTNASHGHALLQQLVAGSQPTLPRLREPLMGPVPCVLPGGLPELHNLDHINAWLQAAAVAAPIPDAWTTEEHPLPQHNHAHKLQQAPLAALPPASLNGASARRPISCAAPLTPTRGPCSLRAAGSTSTRSECAYHTSLCLPSLQPSEVQPPNPLPTSQLPAGSLPSQVTHIPSLRNPNPTAPNRTPTVPRPTLPILQPLNSSTQFPAIPAPLPHLPSNPHISNSPPQTLAALWGLPYTHSLPPSTWAPPAVGLAASDSLSADDGSKAGSAPASRCGTPRPCSADSTRPDGPTFDEVDSSHRRPGGPPERAVSLHSLKQVWHLPIAEAGQQLGVGTTRLKKVCRTLGVAKWPSRKLRSMDNLIAAIEDLLATSPGNTSTMQGVLQELRTERELTHQDPTREYDDRFLKLRQSFFKLVHQQRRAQGIATKLPPRQSSKRPSASMADDPLPLAHYLAISLPP